MGTQAADSIGQGSPATGSNMSTSTSIAADMVNEHRTAGTLDTTGLAADVQARAAGDPQVQAALAAAAETQMTPVEQGQFTAAMQAANDNAAFGAPIDGQLTPLDTIAVTADAPSYTPAESTQTQSEEGVGSFFEGLVKGDFGDNDSWSATAGQVVGGFIPFVGQAADARDTIAAIGGVMEGKDGAWGNLGLAAIGWVPGVGDLAKGAIRGGEKVVDAGADIAAQATRHADDIADVARPRIEMDGGTKGDWSPELNARTLKPDTDYIVNGYTYRTDAQGRISDVEGQLDLRTADRNSYQQGVSGREDRLPDDQGGHLIASIFNGPGDRVNMVPMNGNFNMGAWRDMEKTFQTALNEGKTVDVKIEVKYGSDGQRPDNFRVTYAIDGVPRTRMFDNVPGGKK